MRSHIWSMWLATLFWGLNWPAVKIVLQAVPPWSLRTAGLGGGALMLALTALALRRPLGVPRKHWGTLVIAGLLNIAAFNLFAVFSQLAMPASRAAIMTFTMPFWAALFAWAVLGERIDRLRAFSLLLGAAGLALLSTPFWPAIQAGTVPFGLLYVLGAAITWAAGTVFIKRYPIPADPFAVTVWQLFIAAIACGLGAVLFETPSLDLSRGDVATAFAYHVIFPQAVSYALWFALIPHVTASTAALGTLLIPIFGVAGAVLILGEAPTVIDYTGLALILAGVVLDQAMRRPPPRPAGAAGA